MIPDSLMEALRPVTVVVGHYGAGKTNFAVNLALDLRAAGFPVTVIDLDIVNPYFRASEQRVLLEEAGVRLIAPVFSEAGTSLDVPSLTGQISPTIRMAMDDEHVLVDAGGDDVGATALGRFAKDVKMREYAMLYVANRFRNLVADPADALANLREIEVASHLQVTAVANNSHLKDATTLDALRQGFEYARAFCKIASLPLACTTVPSGIVDADAASDVEDAYPISMLVKNPWE